MRKAGVYVARCDGSEMGRTGNYFKITYEYRTHSAYAHVVYNNILNNSQRISRVNRSENISKMDVTKSLLRLPRSTDLRYTYLASS